MVLKEETVQLSLVEATVGRARGMFQKGKSECKMKSMNVLMDNEQGMEAIWVIQGSLASLGSLFPQPLAPLSTLLFELPHPHLVPPSS